MKIRSRLFLLCALPLMVMAAVPAILAQDDATFGLSQADFVLLAEANTATAAVSSMHFDFTANLTIRGVPGANGSLDLEGSGALLPGANPSLDLTVSGLAALSGGSIPLGGQFRIVDGTFYSNLADPNTGEPTGWVGQSVEEVASGLAALIEASLAPGGLVVPAELGDLVSQVQPHQFVGIYREDDTQDESHFVVSLDFDALFASDFVEDMLARAAAFDPNTATPSQLALVLEDSTLRVEQWIGLEDKRVHRALLDLVLNVDPSAIGNQASQGSVALNFDVTLDQFDETVTITVPEVAATLSSDTAITPPVSDQPITANTPIIVELTGQGPVDVLYSAQGAETVNVTVRSVVANTVDPTVEVIDFANGRTLDYNDDRDPSIRDSRLGAFDSAIQGLALPGAGTYIIRVGSYNNTGIGTVEVLVESRTETTASSASAPAVSDSEIIAGSLIPGGTFAYSFRAIEGERVTIAVRDASGTLDPRLLLMDSHFNPLVENDDHSSDDPALDPYDSKIEDFVAPAAGTYNLLVSDFEGAEGAFQLVIVRGGGRVSDFSALEPINPNGTGSDDPNAIALGNAVTLNLDGETAGTRTFYGTAGQQITITARAINPTSPDIDVYITVFDPSGRALAFNDDHGTGDPALGQRDARIGTLVLPTNGAYRIEVDSWFDLGAAVTVEVDEG
jgi:hypothetical protein